MNRYSNRGGSSGISAYEIGNNFIKVKFSSTSRTFTYSYQKAGSIHVENMKELAQRGSGLNTYINRYVKNLFD